MNFRKFVRSFWWAYSYQTGGENGCEGFQTKRWQTHLECWDRGLAVIVAKGSDCLFQCAPTPANTCRELPPRQFAVTTVGGGVTAALAPSLAVVVVGCGRPAPGGFPVPLWLMCCCFRLQEEMLQREEAESTLQSFRQVCRLLFYTQPAAPWNQPSRGSKSYLPQVLKGAELHVCM